MENRSENKMQIKSTDILENKSVQNKRSKNGEVECNKIIGDNLEIAFKGDNKNDEMDNLSSCNFSSDGDNTKTDSQVKIVTKNCEHKNCEHKNCNSKKKREEEKVAQKEEDKRTSSLNKKRKYNKRKECSRWEEFVQPTLKEVASYIKEKKLCVDAEIWYYFYLSNDFYIGQRKMKNWKASVLVWHKRVKGNAGFQTIDDIKTSEDKKKFSKEIETIIENSIKKNLKYFRKQSYYDYKGNIISSKDMTQEEWDARTERFRKTIDELLNEDIEAFKKRL